MREECRCKFVLRRRIVLACPSQVKSSRLDGTPVEKGPRARMRRHMLATRDAADAERLTPVVSEVAEAASVARDGVPLFPEPGGDDPGGGDEALGPILGWTRSPEANGRGVLS
jgi:hypothetical protein